jgi:two-component system phosphate regulon response regulator PhoB
MATILIAEDEDDIRQGQKVYLAQAGHTVLEASDGKQAMQLWQDKSPDLIVLDINMPLKDGLSVCRDIRASDTRTPIIMVTAKAEEMDELVGLSLGADDYQKKPFSSEVFVARVKALLRRGTTGQDLEFGSFIIHSDNQSITTDNGTIEMGTLPFKILHLLASRPGYIFSRQDILDQVYGNNSDSVFDRVIDAHIKIMRKHLGSNASHIKTVIGSGYKFVP